MHWNDHFSCSLACYDWKVALWKRCTSVNQRKLCFVKNAWARCLKIITKVSFNKASETNYVYILNEQKFIKKCQKIFILASFSKTEVCGQTVLPDTPEHVTLTATSKPDYLGNIMGTKIVLNTTLPCILDVKIFLMKNTTLDIFEF